MVCRVEMIINLRAKITNTKKHKNNELTVSRILHRSKKNTNMQTQTKIVISAARRKKSKLC